ncbi:MAG: single-stranded DNA-binding protein [Thermodesulfobacteriota bacterium]
MFNYCFLSGEVLTEPETKRYGKEGVTIFELAVMTGHVRAGAIRITCYFRLAVAAAKHIHQGDYVAVMGYLFWRFNEVEGKKGPEIVALDLEFVRSDSHVLGLVFLDAEEDEGKE